MKVKILLVAATYKEIQDIIHQLVENGAEVNASNYKIGLCTVIPVITGIGGVQTVFSLTTLKDLESVDLCLNIGIAGSFSFKNPAGTVVKVVKDCFADLGIEDKDGSFKDIFEIGLQDNNQFPFENGWLTSVQAGDYFKNLKAVNAISVNKVSGSAKSIAAISLKYNPDIETMEGASVFYVCKMLKIPCIQVRSISNMVEPRNRDSWDMELALKNLTTTIVQFLLSSKSNA